MQNDFTRTKMFRCDSLSDLVSFVQFKIREKHPWKHSSMGVFQAFKIVQMGSFKRYVTPEGGREGSKLCYKPLQKLGGGEGCSSNPLRKADKIKKLFFVLFNLKKPGI